MLVGVGDDAGSVSVVLLVVLLGAGAGAYCVSLLMVLLGAGTGALASSTLAVGFRWWRSLLAWVHVHGVDATSSSVNTVFLWCVHDVYMVQIWCR